MASFSMTREEPPSETVSLETEGTEALKQYLRKRKLKVTGTKDELVARVFAAHEMSVPPVLTAEEERKEKGTGYHKLLSVPDGQLPDPFLLEGGWLKEDEGIKFWPQTMFPDIAKFLFRDPASRTRPLNERLMSDYKEVKAFSYFASNWLREVFYHQIGDTSTFCFLKAECTPSQRVSDTPHKAWVCIEKKTGYIQSAYCSCFAGYVFLRVCL